MLTDIPDFKKPAYINISNNTYRFKDGHALDSHILFFLFSINSYQIHSHAATSFTLINALEEIQRPCGDSLEMFSRDFPYPESGFYLDHYADYQLLAIQPDSSVVTADVSLPFPGESCLYDLVFYGIGESHGGSSFIILVADRQVGTFTLPRSMAEWEAGDRYNLVIDNVSVSTWDEIRVKGTTASDDSIVWNRARWLKLEFNPKNFIPEYVEQNGLVVIEAESFRTKEHFSIHLHHGYLSLRLTGWHWYREFIL